MSKKNLVKVHVLLDFGPLKALGHGCDSVCLIDAEFAAAVVKLGYAEFVPEPKTMAAPDKPETRPEPTGGVETR